MRMSCRAADELGRCDVLEGLRRNTYRAARLGEKFCGVDRFVIQSSAMFGGQRASSNHASLPCSGANREKKNLRRGVNRFVSQSGGQRVLCVSAEVDQTERAAAYQTPKQSELTSYNKYLQIPTLCSISYAVISPRSHSSARPREGLSIKSLPAQFLQRGRAEAEAKKPQPEASRRADVSTTTTTSSSTSTSTSSTTSASTWRERRCFRRQRR
jgi:hypothetical protein